MTNPLLSTAALPDFAAIRPEHVQPAITELLAAMGVEVPGIKQVFYGVVLLVVVMFLPNGIWPPLARKLGLAK